MSTKITVEHGEGFHLFKECFDEDGSLHLAIEGDLDYIIEAIRGRTELTFRIPEEVAKKLLKDKFL